MDNKKYEIIGKLGHAINMSTSGKINYKVRQFVTTNLRNQTNTGVIYLNVINNLEIPDRWKI